VWFHFPFKFYLCFGLLVINPMRYGLTFILTLALCFSGQAILMRAFGARTAKSESNFFSSLARIQNGVREPQARIYLLGSSMTGRFPDRGSGFEGIANLGCDGGSAVDTLRAIDRGILPRAKWIVIEGNTLLRAISPRPSEVARAMEAPWFKLGRQIRAFSAASRPSTLLYGQLLSHKTGRFPPPGEGLPISHHPLLRYEPVSLSPSEIQLVDECADIVTRLRAAGSRFLIVFLPPGAPPDSPNFRIPLALAVRAGIPFWDLTKELPQGAVRFTDGVHMDARSAAATVDSIRGVLGKP
jgi:hypothetical protein